MRGHAESAREAPSSEGYVECASCHPDGARDGMTWDVPDLAVATANEIESAAVAMHLVTGKYTWLSGRKSSRTIEPKISSLAILHFSRRERT